jgi:hypothetical protein
MRTLYRSYPQESDRLELSVWVRARGGTGRGMLLARELVDYISRQVVKRMSPLWIESSDPNLAAEFIAGTIETDLAVEDQLNDEVREVLSQYSEYMRREGVSYQDMFRRIKNTLITQRKVIRAAGRDSGDPMKLSRDKINDLSHKVVAALRKSRDFRLKRDPNDVRLELVKIMTDLLQTEEKVDRAARTKIRTQKREISEGTEEWDLLHRRYYAEELKKLGIDLSGR